jgi:prepilin-type N-terminal cleavage/methylation domain-containing protein
MNLPYPSGELPHCDAEQGFTFIENLIAMAIIVLFFGALFAVNSQGLYLLNSGREAVVANVCLRDRVEQLRDCSWVQLTDSTYLRTSVLNSAPTGSSNLGQLTETLAINSYPDAVNPPISVVRSNGSVSVASTNAAIANGALIRVDATLSWTAGPGGRPRSQTTSTLIARYQ